MPDTRTILPSVCALDCPDSCALEITVESGRVVRLAGAAGHPATRGFACVKMARYPDRQEQADRLLVPKRRVGQKGEGRFEDVDWDTALDCIADRLRGILAEHGPRTVLPYHYAGTMGLLEGESPRSFFRALGAIELDQTICATTGSAGWEAGYGPYKLGTDPEELVHSRAIVLWGINALRSHSHLAPFLTEARRRGARILHIDPFRNETSRFADEHWQVRVGTDAALALGIGGEIVRSGLADRDYLDRHASGLEEYVAACAEWPLDRVADFCGVDASAVAAMAAWWAKSESPFIQVGYGMTRNEGGGNAMRAVSLLPALVGGWKRRGGGGCLSTSGGFRLARDRITGASRLRPDARHVNMVQLASALEPGASDIRAMFVFNSNPAAVAPDSSRVRAGLAREDLFTVVLEHFQTDTADYADFLLPATTFLEHADVYGSYGHYHLQYADPVVPPRGLARSNRWFFARLAERLGLEEPSLFWDTPRLVAELLSSGHPWLAGIDPERLMREKSVKLALPEPFLPYADGSHFPDGRIRFAPAPRQVEFEVLPSADFPLRLVSPPGPFVVNTTMGNVPGIIRQAGGEPHVIVHPADASRAGVVDGARIRIVSDRGSIVRKAVVSEDARQGVLVAVGQWWPKLSPDGKSLNDLTSERLTDLGAGSTFGNPVVRIAPA
jgi:anaerobic selenocysteine-containing dehydrogenase